MNSNKVEYGVQPAYNESLLPSCPPSYSEAVASFVPIEPSANHLPYPRQPDLDSKGVISQGTKAPDCIVQPITLTLPITVGPKSVYLQCPHCHSHVSTIVTSSYQKSAHFACFFLFFCGCCLCSCIPYCLAPFKNRHHHCPKCKSFIGTYRG